MKDLFVFSSVGSNHSVEYKDKVLTSWEINSFDNGCVVFNHENGFDYTKYFNNIMFREGFKFPNLFYYLKSNTNILKDYKYVCVLDDDLLFNQKNTFNYVIQIMNQFNLHICSISNISKNKSPYSIMDSPKTINELWITNFCEMGFMIIESGLLNSFSEYYHESNLQNICFDYGMDFAICNFANSCNANIGIIKNMSYTNPERTRKNISYIRLDKNKNENLSLFKPIIQSRHTI